MFRIMMIILIAVVISMPATAYSVCRMKCVWNAQGICEYKNVCDGAYNMPDYTIPPASPVPPPKPLPVYPPYGTSQCQWILVNNQWQSVCW